MRKRPLISGLIVALVLLVVGVTWYLRIPTAPPVAAAAVAVVEAPKPVHPGTEGSLVAVTTPPNLFNGKLSPEASSMEEFSSNPKRDPEEQQVLDIAGEHGVEDAAKVQRLLSMIPTLQPDAQSLAVEHATALIPDSDYLKHRAQLFQVANTPEMRMAVMDDSLTRGEELRLPNLLEMMRNSTSDEEKQEIREILEAYLDQDYGPQPGAWDAPLRKWVAENSDN